MKAGEIIRFIYSGQRAEILEDYLDGSYRVWLLEEDEESIAFGDDVVPEAHYTGPQISDIQREFGKKKPKKAPKGLSTEELFYTKEEIDARKAGRPLPRKEAPIPVYQAPKIEGKAAENKGVYLAFYPYAQGQYSIYLVNDTPYGFNFEFELRILQERAQELKQHIGPHDYFPIAEFAHANLNDSPQLILRLPIFELEHSFKLKYKKWIKLQQAIPLLGLELEGYPCFSLAELEARKAQPKTNLKKYTLAQRKKQMHKEIHRRYYNKQDAQRLAHFESRLDLHIELIFPEDYKDLQSFECLEFQIEALEDYLNQALEIGFSGQLEIIHGVGKGRLMKETHRRLDHLKRKKMIRGYQCEGGNTFVKF